MPAANRRQLALPPNGAELAELASKEFQAELMRYFKVHLAYPNATLKIQWSANFYTTPQHYSDELLLKVATEGVTETSLQDSGIEPQMEMGAIELGIQSPATSPVLTRPGIPSPSQAPVATATESAGRRDVNARRGHGIDFVGGKPANPDLANVGDQSSILAGARQALGDLEVNKNPEPLHDSTIVVGEGKKDG